MLEHVGQVRAVDVGAGGEVALGDLFRLAAAIEVADDHRGRERLDADDAEAQVVEELQHRAQRGGELGEAEHPLELLGLHVDEERGLVEPKIELGDQVLHLPQKLHRPHVATLTPGTAACTGAKATWCTRGSVMRMSGLSVVSVGRVGGAYGSAGARGRPVRAAGVA